MGEGSRIESGFSKKPEALKKIRMAIGAALAIPLRFEQKDKLPVKEDQPLTQYPTNNSPVSSETIRQQPEE